MGVAEHGETLLIMQPQLLCILHPTPQGEESTDLLLVGRFCKALEGGRLHNSLTEGNDRVCHLNVCREGRRQQRGREKRVKGEVQVRGGGFHCLTYLGVHLPEVVHDTVQVELPSAKDDMFTGLLHLQQVWVKG